MNSQRTALVPYLIGDLYALIQRVEDYPQFMPWCVAATVHERSETAVKASLGFNYLGLPLQLQTHNTMQAPQLIRIEMASGPFSNFVAQWALSPLGEGGLAGTRVVFDLRYELAGGLLDRLAAKAAQAVAQSMMDAFMHRADAALKAAGT